MKNNEIMVSARFSKKGDDSFVKSRELTFLVLKSITLRELTEGIFYGLRKKAKSGFDYGDVDLSMTECFEIMKEYLQKYPFINIKYKSIGFTECKDIKQEIITESCIDFNRIIAEYNEAENVKIYDLTLEELGIVTASVLDFDLNAVKAEGPYIFTDSDDKQMTSPSYVVKEKNLEYNISTRDINVVEPSVIEIAPAGEYPKIEGGALGGSMLTSMISIMMGVGMRVGMRYMGGSAMASMGNSMIIMSVGMGLVSATTMLVNGISQRRKSIRNADDWVSNYESYILKKLKQIEDYQRQDIQYMNTVYPNVSKLFDGVRNASDAIFSRSHNDDDYLMISLGQSRQIEPMFTISAEKKDEGLSEPITYRLEQIVNPTNDTHFVFRIDQPDEKARTKLRKQQRKLRKKDKKNGTTELKNIVDVNNSDELLLSELAYDLAHNDPADIGTTDNSSNGKSRVGFRYLRDYKNPRNLPPLLFEMKNCGALGVIYDPVSDDKVNSEGDPALNFIRHVVFELSYYHSPENLQFVFFFKRTDNIDERDRTIENYKYLPHTNELFGNSLSQFVFDKKSAGDVYSALFGIMNERSGSIKTNDDNGDGGDEKSEDQNFTQIVCIMFDDYDIKETVFSRFLPEPPKQGEDFKNQLGLSFIFLKDKKGMLPKYCSSMIELCTGPRGELTRRYNVLSRETLAHNSNAADTSSMVDKKRFESDYLFKDHFQYLDHNNNTCRVDVKKEFGSAYRQLSSLYYKRIAENGKVPDVVSLFEIWGIDKEAVTDDPAQSKVYTMIKDYWDSPQNDITKGLSVPIGKNEHGVTYLDMHQNGDGPHGLVAGTTGSGKSETLITYVIGCCMKYRPDELNFMLVDMKGGGFSDRLGNLPHLVGAVTNTTGEAEGIAPEYMLKRFLETLNAEIKRREVVLKELDTDNIDSYMRTRKTVLKYREDIQKGTRTLTSIKKEFINKDNRIKACDPENPEPKPLSHLLLIVDEFTELKRFSSESNDIDFIKDITTIARVGRTLGFHIILVSQNIEGAITEDIRVNSKARICLKVATKSASKDMIGTPDAAAATMPGHGRAYILVGTGSRYEYFQSAYTGANRNLSIKGDVNMTMVPECGGFDDSFYNSKKDNIRMAKQNKSVNEDDNQLNYIINTINALKDDYEPSIQLFLNPLKADVESVMDKTEWEGI
ncbi:FtsK/SpoIIIE domain-containing protein [Ruminococcus albus]|uniref:FtsK/SpoIIIE domain-containing protein n=1 Tax=Ruminococcus albus TaxID=1264 RepID=UPI000467D7C5|nr:FtsK/SpoIIIE domain-containing protein [Ruminococcus albus]